MNTKGTDGARRTDVRMLLGCSAQRERRGLVGVVYIVMIQLYLVLSFGPVSCMQACTLYYGFMCVISDSL